MPILRGLREWPGHEFWPDAISVLDPQPANASRMETAAQVTDSYLLALAVSRGGKLATFDRRLSTAAVVGGKAALLLIA